MSVAEQEEQLRGEHIKKYGLKLKLFILNCGALNFTQIGHDIAREFKTKLDFNEEEPESIFECILKSKFLQYSTIVFIFTGYCRCRLHILQAVLFCINENQYLRYKAKLILLNHVERCGYRSHRSEFFDNRFKDDVQLNSGVYDNIIVFQNNIQNEMDISQTYVIMLLIAAASPLQSIQEILTYSNRPTKHEVVRASTNAELYFYTINPALAIVVNNYYFSNPHSIREGSDLDVMQLIRELKIARIPYILIEDCDRQELLQILGYIEKKDFKPLKSFLFFLMSHGDADNVIYTHDGFVNIETDIVKPIQSNKSLENAETLIVLNACRGPIDLEYAPEEDFEEIHPTKADNLKNNTIVLYSVPDRVQSPRSAEEGCPFIQRFCHHFRKIDHTKDIRQMEAQIDKDLKELDYFYGLEKCSELVMNTEEDVLHNIIKTPTNVVGMMELIDSILGDFPTRKEKVDEAELGACGGVAAEEVEEHDAYGGHRMRTLFHICGTLNEMKFEKKAMIEKYFAADLDKDKGGGGRARRGRKE